MVSARRVGGGEDICQGNRGQGTDMDQPNDVVAHGGHGRQVGVPDDDVGGPQVLRGVLPDLVAVI